MAAMQSLFGRCDMRVVLNSRPFCAGIGLQSHTKPPRTGRPPATCAVNNARIRCVATASKADVQPVEEAQDGLLKAIRYEWRNGFCNTQGNFSRFDSVLCRHLQALSEKNSTFVDLLPAASKYESLSLPQRQNLLQQAEAALKATNAMSAADETNITKVTRKRATRRAPADASSSLQESTGSVERATRKRSARKSKAVEQETAQPSDSKSTSASVAWAQSVMEVPSSINAAAEIPAELSAGVAMTVDAQEDDLLERGDIASDSQPSTSSSQFAPSPIDVSVSRISTLTPLQKKKLEGSNIHTLRMLLRHFPRRYASVVSWHEEGALEEGKHVTLVARIKSCRAFPSKFKGCVEICIAPASLSAFDNPDNSSRPEQLWLYMFFHGPRFTKPGFLFYIARQYQIGSTVAVTGELQYGSRGWTMKAGFELEVLDEAVSDLRASEAPNRLMAMYSSRGSCNPAFFSSVVQRALQALPESIDPLPSAIRTAYNLVPLEQAYLDIHMPVDASAADGARRRHVFDEFFYLQLWLLLSRQRQQAQAPPASCQEGRLSGVAKAVLDTLPYKLTRSQKQTLQEIVSDMRRPAPMSRLLQGDVGSGKTIVAFLALMTAVDMGFQGALMVPTEVLAEQHYERLKALVELLPSSTRPEVALLTGSSGARTRRGVYEGLQTGRIHLVVGTHALISSGVEFNALGLAVIDEQHRFGVDQRTALQQKGRTASNDYAAPHVLAMTATPIPRSLALATYGDMALSQITELPPGRSPVATKLIKATATGRKASYKRVRAELDKGGRAFIVFPLVEDSETFQDMRSATSEFKNLQADELAGYPCGLLHGRMAPEEKDAALQGFKDGRTSILIATTVIEVGIDIPDATIMLVEHAERFGLAQLHQLRGRVGRGSKPSQCILLCSTAAAMERLRIMEASQDGFVIANVDMRLRGPGEMLGTRQSGKNLAFTLASLMDDADILEEARQAAMDLLRDYPQLEGLEKLQQELAFSRVPAEVDG